jgi:dihydropteroate synthase
MAVRPAGVLRLGCRAFGPSQLVVMAVVAAGAFGDPAAGMERVRAVVAEGADVVEVLGGAGGEGPGSPGGEVEEIGRVVPFVATVRDAYPEMVVGVSTGRREVAREACAAGADLLSCDGPYPVEPLGPSGFGGFWPGEVAAEFGAGVICPPGLAVRAVEAGVEPERIVVGMDGFAGLAELVASGWPVLVSLSDQDEAGGVAGGVNGSPGGGVAGGLAAAAVGAWLGARVFRVPWIGQTRRALRMVSAIRGDSPPARAVRGLALNAGERGPGQQSRTACGLTIGDQRRDETLISLRYRVVKVGPGYAVKPEPCLVAPKRPVVRLAPQDRGGSGFCGVSGPPQRTIFSFKDGSSAVNRCCLERVSES